MQHLLGYVDREKLSPLKIVANAGNGWALLRKSLHDPKMPLNIESDDAGGVSLIATRIHHFLSQFDGLDVPDMQ